MPSHPSNLDLTLQELLAQRSSKGRFRSLKEYETDAGSIGSSKLDKGKAKADQPFLDFSSNDYLSLTSSPHLRAAFLARLAAEPSILGSTGSRLLSGGTTSHSALERRFATHFNGPGASADTALLFNSGWEANVSFFSTVPQPDDWIVYDELVHASVHSGMRASRVPVRRRRAVKHSDVEDLKNVLAEIAGTAANDAAASSTKGQVGTGTVFLALESLYSMDGDFCPLPQFLDTFDRYVPKERQCVVLDEAHSTGVYGAGGRGIVSALRYEDRVAVRLMTFGKAVGSSGAVLLCSSTIRSFLINFARPLIFSTALPHSTIISLQCAWDLLDGAEGDERRSALTRIQNLFHQLVDPIIARSQSGITSPTGRGLLSLPDAPDIEPFPLSLRPHHPSSRILPPNPKSPIIGLLSPTPHALSAFLLDRGMIVRPVVPPTVPPGSERVRICLRAGMGEEGIRKLAGALEEWVDMKQKEGQEVQRRVPRQQGAVNDGGDGAWGIRAKL